MAWRAHLVAQGYKLPHKGKGKMLPVYRPVPAGGRPPRITDPAIYAAKDSDTAFLTDKTIEALTVRHDMSWFAHVTFIRPHPPFVAPAPYNKLIEPAGLPKPNPDYNPEASPTGRRGRRRRGGPGGRGPGGPNAGGRPGGGGGRPGGPRPGGRP